MGPDSFLSQATRVNFIKNYLCRRYGGGMEIKMSEFIDFLVRPSAGSAIIRMTLAMICGGVVGIERGAKRRPAGFRTHMLVCMGAAMTMIISQYLWLECHLSTDLSRLGAQVINGIGFLGAGTIIVTGKQQVKGLTTAAGLWASAIMGLAIGAGFYFGAIVGFLFIILSITLFGRLEKWLISRSKGINFYIEYSEAEDIGKIIECLKGMNIKILDVEIIRMRSSGGLQPGAMFSVLMKKRVDHSEIMAAVSNIPTVVLVEEV